MEHHYTPTPEAPVGGVYSSRTKKILPVFNGATGGYSVVPNGEQCNYPSTYVGA